MSLPSGLMCRQRQLVFNRLLSDRLIKAELRFSKLWHGGVPFFVNLIVIFSYKLFYSGFIRIRDAFFWQGAVCVY